MMKIYESKELKYLKELQRNRIPENRDLDNGLRLNRNERVDGWEKKILSDIFSNQMRIEVNQIYDHKKKNLLMIIMN